MTLHVFLQAFEGKVYLPGNSFCDIFGMVKCLFQGFCDLQLGDQKGHDLNHLVHAINS